MTLTTHPIRIPDQTSVRPEFIRLPKTGEHDPWTRVEQINTERAGVAMQREQFRPPVRSCTLRRSGKARGVRLVDFQSLLDHLHSNVEPAYVGNDDTVRAEVTNRQTTSVQKLGSDQPLRVIISVRVEKDADNGAAIVLPLTQKPI